MYDDYDNYVAYIESLFILGLDVYVYTCNSAHCKQFW